MNYLKLEAKILDWYKKIPQGIKKSVVISFLIINFAFLFHSINFMFGDHDWLYVRGGTFWKEGSFEGRPLHFVLQGVFFNGQILPILNNIISFFALSLSGIMLAKYWKIPVSTLNYTLFTVLIAVLPYTLVWLYYAKDALINLCLPLIAISALVISEKASINKNIYLHMLSQLLFVFAFSSYMAIISYIGICFVGKVIFAYIYEDKSFVSIVKQHIYSVLDVFIATLIFVVILKIIPPTSEYNTNLISMDYVLPKLKDTLVAMVAQFVITLPFMDIKFKILLLVLSFVGFVIMLCKGGSDKFLPIICLSFVILFISKCVSPNFAKLLKISCSDNGLVFAISTISAQ